MAFPYEISQAMVQCFGKCFHYKDGVAAFMRQAGVSSLLIEKYRDEPKFVWARHVISDLNQTEQGHEILRRMLTELCKLRKVPDEKVPDRNAALDALRELKELAVSHDLYVEDKKSVGTQRQELAKQKENIVAERSSKLRELQKSFSDGLTNPDRQATGYVLEAILRELFGLFDIDYRKPYKTAVAKISLPKRRSAGFREKWRGSWKVREDCSSPCKACGLKSWTLSVAEDATSSSWTATTSPRFSKGWWTSGTH
jgi:hypothetical protein